MLNGSERPEAIIPDWPAPRRVRAASSTRAGGTSVGPWRGLNLAVHVGDDGEAVRRNRALLRRGLDLPGEPRWLLQRHTARVVEASGPQAEGEAQGSRPADGIVARAPDLVCAVLTADCLPLLLCDREASVVAALHAGWRGIAAGIVEAGVQATGVPPVRLMAWLGPAIGAERYEVGLDVRDAMLSGDPDAGTAFRPSGPRKWQADLERIVRRRLARCGVGSVHGGGRCTASDPRRFFSRRRDGPTGRMATLIWLA